MLPGRLEAGEHRNKLAERTSGRCRVEVLYPPTSVVTWHLMIILHLLIEPAHTGRVRGSDPELKEIRSCDVHGYV